MSSAKKISKIRIRLRLLRLGELNIRLMGDILHTFRLVDYMHRNNQWEFQDPKMEVLYHIRPYFVGIFPYCT
jgi:hypothetical protein